MAGGKGRPKKGKGMKVSDGQTIKTGEILSRGYAQYKPGKNVSGRDTMHAVCDGKIYFSKKKTPHGKVRTFINVLPEAKK